MLEQCRWVQEVGRQWGQCKWGLELPGRWGLVRELLERGQGFEWGRDGEQELEQRTSRGEAQRRPQGDAEEPSQEPWGEEAVACCRHRQVQQGRMRAWEPLQGRQRVVVA